MRIFNIWHIYLFIYCLIFIFPSYETANGIKAQEVGTVKKASKPDSTDVIIAKGSFSYTAPDGTVITLNYAADDENGFQPTVSLFN